MPSYLRRTITGATVYFTVCLAQRGSTLLLDEVEILREAVRVTRARRPFAIDAWVVLPDHMHAVWTLPEGDANYADRWGAIKARFSKFVRLKADGRLDPQGRKVGCKPTLRAAEREGARPEDVERLRARRSASKLAKQDAGIWQRRFWEHHIRSEADYRAHVRHCWVNPVKHGLVEHPEAWPYSSLQRDMRAGRVDPGALRGDIGGVISDVA